MDTEPSCSQSGFWLRLNSATETMLYIEPFGIGWQMKPSEDFLVYIAEDRGHLPEIHYSPTGIQVFASLAVIYHNGEKIFDYSEAPKPPPTPFKV